MQTPSPQGRTRESLLYTEALGRGAIPTLPAGGSTLNLHSLTCGFYPRWPSWPRGNGR